jgi:hypothetical protein
MMMVMTEMAVALHLIQTIRQKGALCQLTDLQDGGIWRQSFSTGTNGAQSNWCCWSPSL